MTKQSFVNDHLSFSRLNTFEQCPLKFRFRYVDKLEAEPSDPLKFGAAIHAVLEELVREHVEAERAGPLPHERALELLRRMWTSEDLTGVALFHEGAEILDSFIRDQGVLNHRDVLAVEKKFELEVGRFNVLGYIDRVDVVDDETIEVIDYKTNRVLFTRDEVDSSLQLSLYHFAARQLWPWAKKIGLTFHVLRHGVRMRTERTPEQLRVAGACVEMLGGMSEETEAFPARLNAHCGWCEHRHACPAYADALKGKRQDICTNTNDLEQVAREREEVANLAKILYARKGELDKILKTHLEDHDELILAGVRYKMLNTAQLHYPFEATLRVLAEATGLSHEDLARRLATVDKKALDALLKEVGQKHDRARIRMLKAELESVADKSFSPRLWTKRVPA